MRNYAVIVREGRTCVDGQVVVGLDRTSEAFRVSDSGRFFLGQIELEDDGPATLMVDYGSAIPIMGCGEGLGTLEVVGGYAVAGAALRIALGEAQEIGSQAFFFVSKDSWLDDAGCGKTTAVGELLLRPPFVSAHAGPIWVLGPVLFDIAFPVELALVDSTWHGQGFFRAPSNASARVPDWKPTSGLRIEVGAP
jgi:hypothetical protein